MARVRLCKSAIICTDNLGVVQALRSGEEAGISYKHKDAALLFVRGQFDVIVETDWSLQVTQPQAHFAEKQKRAMMAEQRLSCPCQRRGG